MSRTTSPRRPLDPAGPGTPPSVPRRFDDRDWLGTWDVGPDDRCGTLTVHAVQLVPVYFGLAGVVDATYRDALGREHAASGTLVPGREHLLDVVVGRRRTRRRFRLVHPAFHSGG